MFTRLLLYLCGFHRVRIKGKLASPLEAPIVVFAPHSSFMDAILLSVIDMIPSGLSKIENFQSPITARKQHPLWIYQHVVMQYSIDDICHCMYNNKNKIYHWWVHKLKIYRGIDIPKNRLIFILVSLATRSALYVSYICVNVFLLWHIVFIVGLSTPKIFCRGPQMSSSVL